MAAVETESTGSTFVITLNRPEARNAVNGDIATGLEAAVDEFEANPDLWTAVLCGNGPVFCAGADLKEVAKDGGRSIATKRNGFAGFVQNTERTKPIIAAIDGPALAGGTEIMLACGPPGAPRPAPRPPSRSLSVTSSARARSVLRVLRLTDRTGSQVFMSNTNSALCAPILSGGGTVSAPVGTASWI